MGIKFSNTTKFPNWIKENDWSDNKRLYWISTIMCFSSRDWSQHDYAVSGSPDPEKWALYVLANADSKDEAIEMWRGFCSDYKNYGITE